MLTYLTTHWLGIASVVIGGIFILVFISKGSYSINENEIGIVKKNFSFIPFRSLPIGEQVATKGEVGYQAKILTSGSGWKMPWMYSVTKDKMTYIKHGEIGLVHSLEGKEKEKGKNFPPVVECKKYQDAKEFLRKGGCKGTQLDVLTEGRWSINPKVFSVTYDKVTIINSGFIGIVETKEGKRLEGNIAGYKIDGHNKFTDANAFVLNGGFMGLQEEFLDEGQYDINPQFAKIKQVPVVEIDTGTVGVIYSKAGKEIETEGADDLVGEGYKGIQKKVLKEGKHKINTDIYEVIPVPIHNIKLEWNDEVKTDRGRYDADLKSIVFMSEDEFTIKLPITQTIRIKQEYAPMIVKKMGASPNEIVNEEKTQVKNDGVPLSKKRYGPVKFFVYRVLEEIVINVLKDALPKFVGKDFHNQIETIQSSVSNLIKERLSHHGVEAISTILDFREFPESLSKIISVQHEKLLQEESDIKNSEHELRKAKLEAEKTIIESEAEKKAKQNEIEAVDGIENFKQLKEMKSNEKRPVIIVPGIGGNTTDIGTYNENKILNLPNEEAAKKLLKGKRNQSHKEEDSDSNSE